MSVLFQKSKQVLQGSLLSSSCSLQASTISKIALERSVCVRILHRYKQSGQIIALHEALHEAINSEVG